jgi:hypothetical protein
MIAAVPIRAMAIGTFSRISPKRLTKKSRVTWDALLLLAC